MDKQIVSWKNVIAYAGAFIAFLIGSGFATGQEILQYFTSYGYWGVVGALVVMALLTYAGASFITVGWEQKFDRASDIFYYYCGKYLGGFFDFFTTIFIFLSFLVMIAGAGAVGSQHYGLPVAVGGFGMAAVVVLAVLLGLNGIIAVLGNVGPIIVIISIALGLVAILQNPSGIPEGNSLVPTLEMTRASTNWFFAALSYVGFSILWLAAFMAAMGATANSRKEAAIGGASGAIAFSAAALVLALGLLAYVEQVAGTQIPSLLLAYNVHPVLADAFSVIILLGILTTAMPLLWTVIARFAEDRSPRFRVLTVVLGFGGAVIALFIPFAQMVNIVYVLSGYIGVVLLVMMFIKSFMRLTTKRSDYGKA